MTMEHFPSEAEGRKGLPTNKGPEEMKFVDEGEQALKESENKWRERHSQQFIPVEELVDPDTLEGGSRTPFFEMSDEELEAEMEAGMEDFKDGLSEITEMSETRSEAPSPLPEEIRQIIRENSVSGGTWKKLRPDERAELKRNIQKKIQDYYLSAPKKKLHRRTGKTE